MGNCLRPPKTVNQLLPMANSSYPVIYNDTVNDTDNGTTANLTIKLQLYKCKKDQHWHKKSDNNLKNDLSMISKDSKSKGHKFYFYLVPTFSC